MDTQEWIDAGYNLIIEFGPKVIAAIAIWIIGSWVVKMLLKGLKKKP
jgi:small conductance mechanosensitive channel